MILNFDCHLDGTYKSHGNKSLDMSVKISVNIRYMDWDPTLNRKEKEGPGEALFALFLTMHAM